MQPDQSRSVGQSGATWTVLKSVLSSDSFRATDRSPGFRSVGLSPCHWIACMMCLYTVGQFVLSTGRYHPRSGLKSQPCEREREGEREREREREREPLGVAQLGYIDRI